MVGRIIESEKHVKKIGAVPIFSFPIFSYMTFRHPWTGVRFASLAYVATYL
jgi:hypothetical protein